jgi:cyclopropane fatty-acyl-phospholipid synthase-like methyltransferase
MDFVVESGLVPDILVRCVLKFALLFFNYEYSPQKINDIKRQFILESRNRQESRATEANEPYELPTTFFENFLGPNLKYSACYFEKNSSLESAEERALELYCQRSGLEDGMTVLDIGCGWGSLVMYIAQRYPHCKVVAMSPASRPLAYIRSKALMQSLGNIETIQADLVNYETSAQFDRVFAIEVMEYMEDYEAILSKISNWLIPETGRLFVHSFCHKDIPIRMTAPPSENWLSSFFARGGTLPSQDYFLYFQKDLEYLDHWVLPGGHYSKTFLAWLQRMDCHKDRILLSLEEAYGSKAESFRWYRRWRFFCILLSELFDSKQFLIVHYVFKKK